MHEAIDGEPVLAGRIYLAPGGRHMKVARRDGTAVIALDDGAPVHYCKPAVDPLFASAADVWGSWNLALILTGMGSDGTGGAAEVVKAGGSVIVAGRSHQRGLGHARRRGRGRRVLGRAAARADCAEGRRALFLGAQFMTPEDYEYLRRLLKTRSGLVLSAEKHYLVESRLLPVARKAGLFNLTGLVARLRGPDAEPLIVEVVEAMTTNESFFFRDKVPFEHFRDTIMPALLSARAASRRIRIWCAAAATGQEPYSLAIALKEMGKDLRGWRIEIVATDLSTEVLEKAKSGIYSQFEVQRGLPALMLIKYFSQVGETWQIAPEIRGMVKFMPLNLLNDFAASRPLRRGAVPQRADLLRPGHQDRRARAHRRRHRARRLPGAGRRRDGGRADRRVSGRSPTSAASTASRTARRRGNVIGLQRRSRASRRSGSQRAERQPAALPALVPGRAPRLLQMAAAE